MKNLIFYLSLIALFSCSGGGGDGGGSDSTNSRQSEEATSSLSGQLTYDSVPITNSGLNYNGTEQKPLRQVYVEIFDSDTNEVVASGNTDEEGNYSIKFPPSATNIHLVIYAEVKSPSIIVEDNTNNDAEYAVLTTDIQITDVDTEVVAINIPSGWSGTNNAGTYAGDRLSAPFSILDTTLLAAQKVIEARPDVTLPPLKINWSIRNIGAPGDRRQGQIGTTSFNPADGELYILGTENVDTDEFDTHILVHEWGHYMEDRIGRSDSPGGPHSGGEKVDMSLAFGEGYGNGLSAMILDPSITYRDSAGERQSQTVVSFSLETSPDPNPGWFSEVSVQEILFDVYQDNGLKAVLDVMLGSQKNTPALTSIFSFINGLKTTLPDQVSQIDSLTSAKNISPVQDDFGTGETNDGGFPSSLPVFKELTSGAGPVPFTLEGRGSRSNELANVRYYKFTATSGSTDLTWQSEDSYNLFVLTNGNAVFSDAQRATAEGGLGPFSQSVRTSSGNQHVIKVTADGPLVFSEGAGIDFQAQIE